MANMSYCRFENTYNDLMACSYYMTDDLSESEAKYRKQLIELCKEIIEEHELNKMSDDVWGDDDWGFGVVVDEGEGAE
jgi:hypothetical protein